MYVTALDLGQVKDYTALCVLEVTQDWDEEWNPITYFDLRHLERFPLKTDYPSIVRYTRSLIHRPPLTPQNCRLVIDHTGVGRPVFDMFIDAGIFNLVGITITSGRTVSEPESNQLLVPKIDLVACVQLGLSKRILRIAEDLELARTLQDELAMFEVKITPAAHETFNARQGQHDDLVLALACALWFAMHPRDAGVSF
jgi:hypothetical protein